jgi:hypothetical protein
MCKIRLFYHPFITIITPYLILNIPVPRAATGRRWAPAQQAPFYGISF